MLIKVKRVVLNTDENDIIETKEAGEEMRVLRCEDVRAADRAAQKIGIVGIVLMEYAAVALAKAVEKAQVKYGGRVAVVCGNGNNGGDGYALARLLCQKKCFQVSIVRQSKPDAICEDAVINEKIAERLGIIMYTYNQFQARDYDIIVDCLFGTGLNRELGSPYVELIEQINRCQAYVIACDIASGLSADNGKVMGCAVRANETITFAAGKLGLYMNEGIACSGRIVIADIGIPDSLLHGYEAFTILDDDLISGFLPVRKAHSHKRSYGSLLMIGAAKGMHGALLMAAEAALRSGAGLVTMMGDEGLAASALTLSEAMFLSYPAQEENFQEILQRYDCISIGNGLGRDTKAMRLVQQVWQSDRPAVFDGDALYLLGKWKERKKRTAPYVLTPHPKELSYLLGIDTARLAENPLEALKLSESGYQNGVIVIKNTKTIISNGKNRYLNTTGNHGLATGGSGDVLCGMILAFMGQAAPSLEAAVCAVYLHGKCADSLSTQMAARSIMPRDIINQIPKELIVLEKN